MAGGGIQILTLLCSGCCDVKIEGENYKSIKMMINKEKMQQSLICFTLAVLVITIIIFLFSLCTHCICAKCRGRTLKVYLEDKFCVKYQTANFEACD